MTTPNDTSSTDSQMHNNIMAASSRDRPPMLATGRYPQWRLRFLRYINTRPHGEALRKCILSGPYKPTTVLVQAVEATDDSSAIPEHTTVETPMNMSPENKAYFLPEKEAIHLILTGISDEIYSTVDACQIAQEMWEAIERLQQEWSRFVMIVKKQHKLDEVLYHKLFDIPKQYQNEVNELRAEILARNSNPLTLECRKPKRVKDSAYHKEKMLLCKQAEQGVPLQAEQYDWLADTNEEIDEQELEAHYSYMAKIQEVPTAYSCTNSEPLEQNDQYDVESDDKRVELANLKLDTEFEKYKAFNDRTIDYDKLERKLNETLGQLALKDIKIKEGLKTKAYEISVVKENHDDLIKQSLLTKSHYEGLVKQKTKKEMHADLKYVESLKKEIDEFEYDKAEFSNMYDVILQECVSNDVISSYLLSLSDLDALAELQCMYLHKVKECDCLAQKLLKQTEFVKNDTVWNEQASNVFRKEREQYFKIQDLKAQLQDKNIAISELKKLIEKGKGKYVDTKFDKPSVVRQPNAQRIPKPLVLGKHAPFSNSLERIYFSKTKSVPKTNVSEGLSKPVTAQTLPQTARQAIVQLIIFIVDSGCMKHMTGNLKLLYNFVKKFLDLEISGLTARIKLLEEKDRGSAEPFQDDAPIKGRSMEIGEEVGLQEQIDAQVAKEIEEEIAREDQRINEQLARDAEIARIHAKEELKMLIDGLDRSNEMIAKHLQEYEQAAADLSIGEKIKLINELKQREFYMSILKSHARWKTKHFRGMTIEEIKEKFIPVWKQLEDFVPMSSIEEGKRMKRKGLKLDEGSAKRMKTSEDVSEEDLKGMMQLVPVEEFDKEDLHQLWILVKETLSIRQATKEKEKELWVELKRLFKHDFEDQLWTHNQNFMHDPLDWKLYDTCGVHHVFTKDQEIFILVERDYPLRRGLAIVMICNKL
nr:hypothetical protein [Tanacetum cinerariifolium]